MPRLDYKRCRICGRHSDECGNLSHTRQCEDCWRKRLNDSVFEQVAHKGPTFDLWRRRIVASAGGVLLDDVRGSA